MKSPHQGIKRLFFAGYYSWLGIKAGWRSEAAIRQEIIAIAILIPISFWFDISHIERILMILSLLLILIVELINTAVESVVDRIGSEFHQLSGKAKDLGSAAVLLALLTATAVWLLIVPASFF